MDVNIAKSVIDYALKTGVTDFVLAAGKRNLKLIFYLEEIAAKNSVIKLFYWPEERSAAFFALGKIKLLQRPVAIITTSGTAVSNLLPAAIEAYYSALPLLIITADRPKILRGTGAPQAIEQKQIFCEFTQAVYDIDEPLSGDISWHLKCPLHINVCLSDLNDTINSFQLKRKTLSDVHPFTYFLNEVKCPLVVVGALPRQDKQKVVHFLQKLKAPVYLEACSNLRECKELKALQISTSYIFESSTKAGYRIDGVLRLGSVPVVKFFRQLEEKADTILTLSISTEPFRGLSGGLFSQVDSVGDFLSGFQLPEIPKYDFYQWYLFDQALLDYKSLLIDRFENAEQGLMRDLSGILEAQSLVFLGNSLPIRYWQEFAQMAEKNFEVYANRGACGIDGLISTFFGLCKTGEHNVAILGDLSALYDMAGLWALKWCQQMSITIFVINNSGGQIFARFTDQNAILCEHSLSFKHLASFWELEYELWQEIPSNYVFGKAKLIEVRPSNESSRSFDMELKKWIKNYQFGQLAVF